MTNDVKDETGLSEPKKAGEAQLSEGDLGLVSGGAKTNMGCPKCGSEDIHWNNSCGFWFCGKCNEVWS